MAVVTTRKELWTYLKSPEFEIIDLFCADSKCLIRYKLTAETPQSSRLTNVVISAFVTSYARLKLFAEMIKLGRRLLYVDTDSLIYIINIKDDNEYKVPVSKYKFLGELASELCKYGKDAYASEFVSLSPKCYSLRVEVPRADGSLESTFITKCKGFVINHCSRNTLNFQTYKRILDGDQPRVGVVSTLFKCMPLGGVKIDECEKFLTHTFDKRVIIKEGPDKYETQPYGFRGGLE